MVPARAVVTAGVVVPARAARAGAAVPAAAGTETPGFTGDVGNGAATLDSGSGGTPTALAWAGRSSNPISRYTTIVAPVNSTRRTACRTNGTSMTRVALPSTNPNNVSLRPRFHFRT